MGKCRLVAFDMDGTLVRISGAENSWDLIRKIYGIPSFWKEYQEGRITREQAMDMEYKIWAERGITKEKLVSEIVKHIQLVNGSQKLFEELKARGIPTAIISDSPCFVVKEMARKLGAKYVACNEIIFDAEGKACNTKPTHSTKDIRVSKMHALIDFAEREGIETGDCAAIGNDADDISMFKESGLSIAFNCTDSETEDVADISIKSEDIGILIQYLAD